MLLLNVQVPPRHAAPFALVAQSLLVMHWTQEFVAQCGELFRVALRLF